MVIFYSYVNVYQRVNHPFPAYRGYPDDFFSDTAPGTLEPWPSLAQWVLCPFRTCLAQLGEPKGNRPGNEAEKKLMIPIINLWLPILIYLYICVYIGMYLYMYIYTHTSIFEVTLFRGHLTSNWIEVTYRCHIKEIKPKWPLLMFWYRRGSNIKSLNHQPEVLGWMMKRWYDSSAPGTHGPSQHLRGSNDQLGMDWCFKQMMTNNQYPRAKIGT